MRDVRKVREQSQLRLTYSQLLALAGLVTVSLVLAGLLGYYLGRGATAAEQASVAVSQSPLIPEDVETESVATLLALAREKRQADGERLRLDYDDLLPKSDGGVPQVLRTPSRPTVATDDPPPKSRELEPAGLVATDVEPPAVAAPTSPLPEKQPAPVEVAMEDSAAEGVQPDAALDQGGYTIQVSSFQTSEQAQRLVDDLKQKGFGAYSISAEVNQRVWHRVRVGGFGSKAEAEAEMARLKLIRSDLRPMVTFQ